jgi:hydroxymethylpyrimidine pyrophosphatase-like HAD family hydrolase
VAFDLDDTLAVSKSPIDDRMAGLLARLIRVTDVCIISGGRFEQFESQVLRHLPAAGDALASLHLMPTCGTRYYRWVDGDWQLAYAEDLAADDKRRIITVLEEGARDLGLWEERAWGERIEDRGSQITFSALGQQAPPAEKTRQGIDKAYGMRKLMQQLGLAADEILFVGDRLEPGGNDYPVRAVGVRCVEVACWQDTADYVERLLVSAEAAGRRPRLEVPARS